MWFADFFLKDNQYINFYIKEKIKSSQNKVINFSISNNNDYIISNNNK